MEENTLKIGIKCPFCGATDNQHPEKIDEVRKKEVGVVTAKCGECKKKYDLILREHETIDYESEMESRTTQLYVVGGIAVLAVILSPFIGKYLNDKKDEIREVRVREIIPTN